jgi:CBS domain-containing protein
MNTEVVTLDANASLTDLCDCLIDGSFRRVPLTEDGKLYAIAGTSDVIRGILRVERQAV